MALLTGHNLRRAYGDKDIFSSVTISVPHRARIALVGPNGSGKTSLLRLITKQDIPDDGEVVWSKGLQVGFLEQHAEHTLNPDETLWETMLHAVSVLLEQEEKLNRMAARLADEPDLIEAYGEAQHQFELAGGYDYQMRIKMVLSGLGFSESQYQMLTKHLSGGQKTRANLALLLLENLDILVLDEPTNHLDIYAIAWLESYLKDFDGALIIVSHDRYFLDKVSTQTWELVFGHLEEYRGNYSHYVQQREERHANLLAEYERQQEYIKKTEDYIRRNIAGQNTRQAQGRRKRLERFMRDEAIAPPDQMNSMHLRLETDLRSGDKVVETDGIVIGFDEPLFETPPVLLMRGECAALIGPNGAGKTTLLKTILGDLEPLAGDVQLGASVQVGYFAQANESLVPDNRVIDEILGVENMPISEARNYLANFLFQGDDVFKPIAALSGGERGRIALAKLALSGANLLLLDEPTNHLDIDAQEILEEVLDNFAGTILLVSHDRYLIRALATQVWAIEPDAQSLTVFEGGYEEFASWRDQQGGQAKQQSTAGKAPEKQAEAKPNGKPKPNAFMRKKRLNALEEQIEQLETELEQVNMDLAVSSSNGEAGKVAELGRRYTQIESDLDALLREWDSLLAEE